MSESTSIFADWAHRLRSRRQCLPSVCRAYCLHRRDLVLIGCGCNCNYDPCKVMLHFVYLEVDKCSVTL